MDRFPGLSLISEYCLLLLAKLRFNVPERLRALSCWLFYDGFEWDVGVGVVNGAEFGYLVLN